MFCPESACCAAVQVSMGEVTFRLALTDFFLLGGNVRGEWFGGVCDGVVQGLVNFMNFCCIYAFFCIFF